MATHVFRVGDFGDDAPGTDAVAQAASSGTSVPSLRLSADRPHLELRPLASLIARSTRSRCRRPGPRRRPRPKAYEIPPHSFAIRRPVAKCRRFRSPRLPRRLGFDGAFRRPLPRHPRFLSHPSQESRREHHRTKPPSRHRDPRPQVRSADRPARPAPSPAASATPCRSTRRGLAAASSRTSTAIDSSTWAPGSRSLPSATPHPGSSTRSRRRWPSSLIPVSWSPRMRATSRSAST